MVGATRSVGAAAIGALLALLGGTVRAQEFEPRTYAATPVGLNFLAVGYGFSTGGVFLDPALPVEGVEADVHGAVVRYARTFALAGRPAKLKLVLPWASGHWEGLYLGEPRTRDATGLGDVQVGLEVLFAGAEAKSPTEMAAARTRTVWGARLQLVTPTGQYDSSRAINLGANRWAAVPEIGFSSPVGRWSFEGAFGAYLYGGNDNFYGGQQLSQDPLYVVKLHAIRSVRPGFWWALAGGYGYGGRTAVNGVEQDTLQRNWRAAFALAYPVRRNQGVGLLVGTGGNQGAGADFDSIAVSYQVMW